MADTPKKATKKSGTVAKPSTKPAVKPAVKKAAAKTTTPRAVTAKPAVAPKKAATNASPAAAKKPTAVKKPAIKKTSIKPGVLEIDSPKIMLVTDEQRYRMVAEAAYYRAESNSFQSDSVRDWIEAEKDIAALLSGSKR